MTGNEISIFNNGGFDLWHQASFSLHNLSPDRYFMPSEQFFNNITARTRYILMRWWWCLLCAKPTLLTPDCYVLSGEAPNTKFIVLGSTRPGFTNDSGVQLVQTSVLIFFTSCPSSSVCWTYCHFDCRSLSSICNRCKCFCSSSSFCSKTLLYLKINN